MLKKCKNVLNCLFYKVLIVQFLSFVSSVAQENVYGNESSWMGDFVENSVKETLEQSESKLLGRKRMNVGAHVGANFATMTSGKKNESLEGYDSFSGWLGLNGEIGFAFNYFFTQRLAFVSGLDIDVLAFVKLNKGKKIVYKAERNDFVRNGKHRADVNNQSLAYYGISLPLLAQFYVFDDVVWIEGGMKIGWILTGSVRYSLIDDSIEIFGTAYDPFKIKSQVAPSLTAAVGVSWPFSGINVDVGLSIRYCLGDVGIDYRETMAPFGIGFSFNFWIL